MSEILHVVQHGDFCRKNVDVRQGRCSHGLSRWIGNGYAVLGPQSSQYRQLVIHGLSIVVDGRLVLAVDTLGNAPSNFSTHKP